MSTHPPPPPDLPPTLALRSIVVEDVLPSDFRRSHERSPAAIPEELSQLFGSGRATSGGDHKKTTGIIYEQTVASFLDAFMDPDLPFAPQSHGQVLRDMQMLWTVHGFLPPDELKISLMRRYAPDLSSAAFETMRDLLHSRYSDLEPLTGFQRKQHAPIITGLAHLFAVQTGTPVTMVEFDFLNMGGTNEHYRKLIAAAEGVPVSEIDETRAWEYTDKAARIVASLAREAMQVGAAKLGYKDAQVIGFRTGGDEMRLVCVGLDQITTEQIIRDYVQPAIEKFTAEAGLHDHEHGKDRDNPWRRGFGAVCATIPLDKDTQPGHELEQVDHGISENKLMVGIKRRGKLPPPELINSKAPPPHAIFALEHNLPPELREVVRLSRAIRLIDDDEGPANEEDDSGDGERESQADTSLKYATLDADAADDSTLDPAKLGNRKGGAGSGRKKRGKKLDKQNRRQLEASLKKLGVRENLKHLNDNELRAVVETTVVGKLQGDIQRHAQFYGHLKHQCRTGYALEHSAPGQPNNVRATQGYAMPPEQAALLLNASRNVIDVRYARLLQPLPAAPRPFPDVQLPSTLFRTPIERDTQLMHRALEQRGVRLTTAQRNLFNNVLASSSPIDSATRTYVGDVMPEIFGQFAKDAEKLREHLGKNPQLLASLGNPDIKDVKTRGMAISMENLAGINNLLGHDNANIVLNHFAQKIILDSFAASGVAIGRENVEIGHDGGGRMLLAIRPIVGNAAGARILSDQDVLNAQSEINRRMHDLKGANIFEFLTASGGTPPKGLDPLLTFARIEDGKGRPELRGVEATSTIMALDYRNNDNKVIRGGEHKDRLVRAVETEITARRDTALVSYQTQRSQNHGQGTRQADQAIQRHTILGIGQDHPSGGDGGDSEKHQPRRNTGPVQRPG